MEDFLNPHAHVALRKFPYPYHAMLAIQSDIDMTTPSWFESYHRFLNTLDYDGRFQEKGLGLDIGDSFFVAGFGLEPSLWHCRWRYNSEADYLERPDQYSNEPDQARRPDRKLIYPLAPDFIEKYIRTGWIDFLHGGIAATVQDIAAAGYEPRVMDWSRINGQQYYCWLLQRDLLGYIDTFVNHWQVTSNFGNNHPTSKGDTLTHPAYWHDVAEESGIRFTWSYVPGTRCDHSHSDFGVDTLLKPVEFADGRRGWHFERYLHGQDDSDYSSAANRVHLALNRENLDSLVRNHRYEIYYTHLGYWLQQVNGVWRPVAHDDPWPESVDAFKLLQDYVKKGKILVAKSSRVLRYNLAQENLQYEPRRGSDRIGIHITRIADPQFGSFVPRFNDLRGITFYCKRPDCTDVFINGRKIRSALLTRNPPDDWGRWPSITVKWWDPDTADYTQRTLAQVRELHLLDEPDWEDQ
ncbi:MAG: hypothetical protein WBW48_03890 [Anaerolineae bacterium]